MLLAEGLLHKMRVELKDEVNYSLNLSNQLLMNDLIGKNISLKWTGKIVCSNCEKSIKKTFSDGLCYNCFISSPQGSDCILRPELCRAHLGEGRDVAWEEAHHNQPHVVYLAASDIVKVGVTRVTQIPTRWIDQGASAAIIIAETPNRYEAGRLEVELKSFFSDKTNWQRMLKNEVDESIDLLEEKWTLHDQLPSDLREYFSENDEVIEINFPALEFPMKVLSMSFDKTLEISGKLMGIKGQYLIFEEGKVINMRKHTGYFVEISE